MGITGTTGHRGSSRKAETVQIFFEKIPSRTHVRADYIGRAPGRGPEGTGNYSSYYGFGLGIMIAIYVFPPRSSPQTMKYRKSSRLGARGLTGTIFYPSDDRWNDGGGDTGC